MQRPSYLHTINRYFPAPTQYFTDFKPTNVRTFQTLCAPFSSDRDTNPPAVADIDRLRVCRGERRHAHRRTCVRTSSQPHWVEEVNEILSSSTRTLAEILWHRSDSILDTLIKYTINTGMHHSCPAPYLYPLTVLTPPRIPGLLTRCVVRGHWS